MSPQSPVIPLHQQKNVSENYLASNLFLNFSPDNDVKLGARRNVVTEQQTEISGLENQNILKEVCSWWWAKLVCSRLHSEVPKDVTAG